MGVVWRARDQLLDREVAVKEVVISSLIGADERRNAYQRTLREARTAARLSHRGVVAVYDVAEEDGRPWIIMELVPSRSLDQVLTVERRLTALRTGRIGQQLLSALAAAHLAGVLHRDVKPSNVLIATDRSGSGWDERAVLTDFGIAQFEGDPRLTQTGMVMGSPGFTAPERIRGGDATPASDLWSLGATLYAAAEGRGPYEQRGGAITTMSAIINEDAPVAAHSGRLAPVIAALLRREPSARPSASAAARMFAQILPLLAEVAEPPHEPPHEPTHPVAIRSEHAPLPTSAAPSPILQASPAQSKPDVPAADSPVADESAAGDPAPAAEPELASAPDAGVTVSPEPAALADEDRAGEADPESDTPEAKKTEAKNPDAETSGPSQDGEPETAAEPSAEEPEPAPEADAESDVDANADAELEAEAAEDAPLLAAGTADAPGDAAESVGSAESDAPEEDVAAKAAAVMVLEAAPRAAAGPSAAAGPTLIDPPPAEPTLIDREPVGPTLIDREPSGYRPTQLSIPVPKESQRPTFTASQPKDRAVPTFSAARQDQSRADQTRAVRAEPQATFGSPPPPPEAAQRVPYLGSASAAAYNGSAAQYAGPAHVLPDLSSQYTPGTGGGRRQRGQRGARAKPRSGPWRLIALLVGAVVLAVAIGAGAAYALRDHGSGSAATGSTGTGSTTADATTPYASVNALNNPSPVVPAGWKTVRVSAAAAKSAWAGFSIGLPPGWTVSRAGLATDLHGPHNMVLEVDLTPHHYQNMLKEAQYIEAQAVPKWTGYQLLNLGTVPVRSTSGAIWQFDRTTASGLTVAADDILFIKPTSAGPQSYAVYIRAPSDGWGKKYLPVFDEILPTFQTLPAS
jgi:serine/threonine protein kinase